MFDNIGGKLKGLAIVGCSIGIIASIIVTMLLWCTNSFYNSMTGWIVLIAGCLVSWLGSGTCYGFGELIEQSQKQSDYLAQMEKNQKELHQALLGKLEREAPAVDKADDVSSYLPEL